MKEGFSAVLLQSGLEKMVGLILRNVIVICGTSMCRKKTHSPFFTILLKYNDVTRSTHTNMDAMQEQRIDCYWNVDENRIQSRCWTGFTKFTPLSDAHPKANMWSPRGVIKVQTITSPDHVWFELCTNTSKTALKREGQALPPRSRNSRTFGVLKGTEIIHLITKIVGSQSASLRIWKQM